MQEDPHSMAIALAIDEDTFEPHTVLVYPQDDGTQFVVRMTADDLDRAMHALLTARSIMTKIEHDMAGRSDEEKRAVMNAYQSLWEANLN